MFDPSMQSLVFVSELLEHLQNVTPHTAWANGDVAADSALRFDSNGNVVGFTAGSA